jgi:hypothetical protein
LLQQDFDEAITKFVRYSKSLLHLNMSGMGLSEDTLNCLCTKGIRKSKTLLSVHLTGNINELQLLDKVRKWLNVVRSNKRYNDKSSISLTPFESVPVFDQEPHNFVKNDL